MEFTLFEITVALLMVAVSVAMVLWFRQSEASASLRRLMGMTTRLRLNHVIEAGDNPKINAIMKNVRRRCAACPYEGYCERWLAGEVEGPNTFCPNASTFNALAGTTG